MKQKDVYRPRVRQAAMMSSSSGFDPLKTAGLILPKTNSALFDSRSVEIRGLLGSTVTSHGVARVNEHFKFIKEVSLCL